MSRADIIRQRLEAELSPLQLRITDNSANHAGHSGSRTEGETHFRIEIVTRKFSDMRPIDRHRIINKILVDLFEQGLHALEIKAKSPGEE